MRWEDDRTQADLTAPIPPAEVPVEVPVEMLSGERHAFVLKASERPSRVRRRDLYGAEHDAFATQLARHRRWLIALTVAVALLVPPAAVVYGAAIAIARAALQGAW